jgi:bacteriocin biosynthesis cyclodehydratase domain-containing protein
MTAKRKTRVPKARVSKTRAAKANVAKTRANKTRTNKTRANKIPASKRAAKDVLQFAPNFTAFVLPPATVCLYSEHRKFFLHGELYCAIANAIGENGKSADALMRDLSKTYPPDQIQEGLRRLGERRYIVQATPSTTGTVAGFWASLGLPPEVAEQNLAAHRVRVEAFDVKGARELSAALANLGVRVVTRSADFAVILVNDYLDRRLAELNQEHVTGKTPWLLVQPSGPFPLVGPVFRPGESACWTCLSDRMIRNREIKGFLDRAQAQTVAQSPLVQNPFGQSAIQFAAVEIAKAIASGFRTDLSNHIASFDLMGATISKHYVAHRPQCPTCGNKKLWNPKREPQPVDIHPGTKLIMTSGGYR